MHRLRGPFVRDGRLKSSLSLTDLVFQLLPRFSGQFFSLGKLVLTFRKAARLIACGLLVRTIDDLVAVYDSLEVVLCAKAVICLASSTLTKRWSAFESRAASFTTPKKTGCHHGNGMTAQYYRLPVQH